MRPGAAADLLREAAVFDYPALHAMVAGTVSAAPSVFPGLIFERILRPELRELLEGVNSPARSALAAELRCGSFVAVMERASGLRALLPDPGSSGAASMRPSSAQASPVAPGTEPEVVASPLASLVLIVCIEPGGCALVTCSEGEPHAAECFPGDAVLLPADAWRITELRGAALLLRYRRSPAGCD